MSGLNADSLLAAARRQTGLEDFGGDEFVVALRQFVDSVNGESHLTAMGRDIARAETIEYLSNRLHLQRHFAAHPEIAAERIERPVFITGLYRSGTTKLHRLLCHDRRWQYLRTWQTLYPAPLGPDDSSQDRIALTNQLLQRMADFAPGSLEAHPMAAEQPEEEYLLLVQSFRTARLVLNTPSHARWCERQPAEPMYGYFRRCLQLLQWSMRREGGAGRLLLKAPVHLENLPALLAAFPDAKLLITHRDPARSVASNCRMLEHMHYMYADPVDLHRLGEEKLHTAALALERSLAARAELNGAAFMEVRFDDIARRPLELLPPLYEFVGEPLDAAVAERVARGEAELRSQRSAASHRYDLGRYGLDERQVHAATGAYLDWARAQLGMRVR